MFGISASDYAHHDQGREETEEDSAPTEIKVYSLRHTERFANCIGSCEGQDGAGQQRRSQ